VPLPRNIPFQSQRGVIGVDSWFLTRLRTVHSLDSPGKDYHPIQKVVWLFVQLTICYFHGVHYVNQGKYPDYLTGLLIAPVVVQQHLELPTYGTFIL